MYIHARRHSVRNMFCNNWQGTRRWDACFLSCEHAFELRNTMGTASKATHIIWIVGQERFKNICLHWYNGHMGEAWSYCQLDLRLFPSDLFPWMTQNAGAMRSMLTCAPSVSARRWARFARSSRDFPPDNGFQFISFPSLPFHFLSFPFFPSPFLSFLFLPYFSFPSVPSFHFCLLHSDSRLSAFLTVVRLMTSEPNKPSSMRIPMLAMQNIQRCMSQV